MGRLQPGEGIAQTVAEIGEFGLIERIDKILREEAHPLPGNTLGIGDDCALFRPRNGYELLVTCDSLVEGRHYLPRFISPFDLGRRAMAMNISDIGAMGGRPLYALISLGLRADTPVVDLETVYRGFIAELSPFGASIIGGNLTGSEGANSIHITLMGEVPVGRALRRSSANPGDSILVTGYPGQAAAGLRVLLEAEAPDDVRHHPLVQVYNTPSHRAREGEAVALSGLATAMIDTSDGLLGDLGHICHGSGVGARLFLESLPVSPALKETARRMKEDPTDLALQQSDDYELIITCPPEHVDAIRSMVTSINRVPVAVIGSITPNSGRIIGMSPEGPPRDLSPSGWDHFSPGPHV
ncbi:MAG: thiamine-phosphate kinase [Deltaproteobacteria bacterium]|nr:thiamine-phosphate kinase [Deltaproteobacteria bacterium]MBW2050067.1 thiamine-phosphate kinase [Deltaproteobacteria bacterium]MBW2112446.1 thiamine-phosphate kinase [Deltaproteobacteria bacterium]MBW2354718.1 thiamine-phosphate kinase [Deltaproteobacteria bacterium]HDZ89183.1 thiamine-phosphate kinase [Deltaproteobacteria bacterium]